MIRRNADLELMVVEQSHEDVGAKGAVACSLQLLVTHANKLKAFFGLTGERSGAPSGGET